MFPLTIVDNFFETPHFVREYGLSLPYYKSAKGECPGLRTDKLHNVNENFHNYLGEKLISLFYDVDKDKIKGELEVQFQQSFEKYEEGWVHRDSTYFNFAGIVYLTPNAPKNGGTSIYNPIDLTNYDSEQQIKYDFYADREVDLEKVRIEREKNISCFEKTVDINNVFNRCVIYDTSHWHKENKLFGFTKDDCRLTLVFFGRIDVAMGTQYPLVRSKFKSTF